MARAVRGRVEPMLEELSAVSGQGLVQDEVALDLVHGDVAVGSQVHGVAVGARERRAGRRRPPGRDGERGAEPAVAGVGRQASGGGRWTATAAASGEPGPRDGARQEDVEMAEGGEEEREERRPRAKEKARRQVVENEGRAGQGANWSGAGAGLGAPWGGMHVAIRGPARRARPRAGSRAPVGVHVDGLYVVVVLCTGSGLYKEEQAA